MAHEPTVEIDLVKLVLVAVEQLAERDDRALFLRFLAHHLDGLPVRVRVRLLDVVAPQ